MDVVDPLGGAAALVFDSPTGEDGTTSCIGDCPTVYSLVATSAPLAAGYAKGSGDVEAVAWFKSWNNAPSPGTTVAFSLKVAGVEVATGSKTADVMNGAIVEFRVTMAYAGGDVPAGSVVELTVTASNDACDCYLGTAYPRGTSADHPWSVGLPLTAKSGSGGPAAAVKTYQTLTGATAQATKAFANATTQQIQYNWTSSLTQAVLNVSATRSAGNLTVTILDGANKTLLKRTFGATGTERITASAKAGAWRILVNATGFSGSLAFTIAAPAAASGTASSAAASSSGGTQSGASSGTGGTDASGDASASGGASGSGSSSGKGTPAPGLLLALVALAAAMVLARRRA